MGEDEEEEDEALPLPSSAPLQAPTTRPASASPAPAAAALPLPPPVPPAHEKERERGASGSKGPSSSVAAARAKHEVRGEGAKRLARAIRRLLGRSVGAWTPLVPSHSTTTTTNDEQTHTTAGLPHGGRGGDAGAGHGAPRCVRAYGTHTHTPALARGPSLNEWESVSCRTRGQHNTALTDRPSTKPIAAGYDPPAAGGKALSHKAPKALLAAFLQDFAEGGTPHGRWYACAFSTGPRGEETTTSIHRPRHIQSPTHANTQARRPRPLRRPPHHGGHGFSTPLRAAPLGVAQPAAAARPLPGRRGPWFVSRAPQGARCDVQSGGGRDGREWECGGVRGGGEEWWWRRGAATVGATGCGGLRRM